MYYEKAEEFTEIGAGCNLLRTRRECWTASASGSPFESTLFSQAADPDGSVSGQPITRSTLAKTFWIISDIHTSSCIAAI